MQKEENKYIKGLSTKDMVDCEIPDAELRQLYFDYIDLRELNEIDYSVIENVINEGKDKVYNKKLEEYKNSPKQLEKLRVSLKDYVGILRYIEDDTNGILYGIPREKYPSRVRERVARYLDLKYQVDKKILDAFKDSKKLAEYEIDEDDVEID